MRAVLRIERFIFDPGIWRYELRPYKTGLRKGQRRLLRVWGEHRDRRISIRRYCDATLAAYAYHATRRALGIVGLFPDRSDATSHNTMASARLTAAGANSTTGQELAARMRALGVRIADKPLEERRRGEFWWADC
jgi:hypothetical protein